MHSLNFPNLLSGSKRPRIESNPPSPDVIDIYDKFYKITMNSGNFKNISPFQIHKALQAQFGNLANTRKLSDGTLLIEVASEKQSKIAQSLNKLHEYEVTSHPHKSLNIIKGVVTCFDLINSTDEEILENLKSQGVTEVYRLPPRRGSSVPSSTFILSFRLHQLPVKIYAGWYSLRVRPYYPSPMRCFQCQKFGHLAPKCEQEALCPSCGHTQHPGLACTSSPTCINCKGNHSPRYKGCPIYKKEFEIQKIRTTEKISYYEAKRKYIALNPSFAVSFSNIVKSRKPATISIATQCDLGSTNHESSLQLNEDSSSRPPPTSTLTNSSQPPPTSSTKSPHPTTFPSHLKSHSLSIPSNLSNQKPTNPKSHPPSLPKSNANKPTPPPIRKKLNRNSKTTPNSSSESILEISLSDPQMELDSPSGKNTKKK